jgi:hypothetical protein
MTIRRALAAFLLLLPCVATSAAAQGDAVARFDRALMRVLEPGAEEAPWAFPMDADGARVERDG